MLVGKNTSTCGHEKCDKRLGGLGKKRKKRNKISEKKGMFKSSKLAF